MHATPLGVVITHGSEDMIDPSSAISHARQPNWYHRQFPFDHVPDTLISTNALDSARSGPHYPTQCITGCHLHNSVLLFSTAGPARNLISLTEIPIEERSLQLRELAATGYQPYYTRASNPILQLVLSHQPLSGWERPLTLIKNSLPLLAARSSSQIEFYHVKQESTRQSFTLGDLPVAAVSCPRPGQTIEDVAWSQFLIEHCAAICSDGAILDINLSHFSSKKGNSGADVPIGWSPHQTLLSSLPVSLTKGHQAEPTPENIGGGLKQQNSGMSPVLRCRFTPLHPRQLLVSLHSRLGLVDLRNTNNNSTGSNWQEIYRCNPGQWISAITTTSTLQNRNSNYYAAAATTREILLFDVRRPQAVLARWQHGFAVEGPKLKGNEGLRGIRDAPPDSLEFGVGNSITDGTLVLMANNSKYGKSIVCSWEEERERGGISVSRDGKLKETPLRSSSSGPQSKRDSSSSDDEEEEEENEIFSWEPVWWTTIKPHHPPRLLINLQRGYPGGVSKMVEESKSLQRLRQLKSENLETAKEQVRLLRSRHDALKQPRFLGMTVIPLPSTAATDFIIPADQPSSSTAAALNREEENSNRRAVLAMLSPTQEILLAEIAPQSPSQNAASSEVEGQGSFSLSSLQAIYPAATEQQQQSVEEEDVLLDSRGRLREDPQIELRRTAGRKIQNSFPLQYRVKQAVFAQVPIHQSLLNKAIKQYTMDAEDYQTSFTSVPNSSIEQQRGLLQQLVSDSQVPFTALEAWQALTRPQEEEDSALDGSVPVEKGSKKKKKTRKKGNQEEEEELPLRSKSKKKDVAFLTPSAARLTQLAAQSGVLHVSLDEDVLPEALNNLPLFPTNGFENQLEAVAAQVYQIDDSGPSTSMRDSVQNISVFISNLQYLVQSMNGENGLGGTTGASAFNGDIRDREGVIKPGNDAAGGGKVFIPLKSGQKGARMEITLPEKEPSAEAKSMLESLRNRWTENEERG